jgi:hypothetical protein
MGEVLNWRKCKTPDCFRRVGGGASWCCQRCHPRFPQEEHTGACEQNAARRGPWDPARDSPF